MRIGLSIFLSTTLLGSVALAQEYTRPPISNPEVAADSDIMNDTSAYDDGNANIVYVETAAPLVEPEAFAIDWAPPALIVEEVGIAPMDDAFWIGGYWTWAEDRWCWARGRWVVAPQPGYTWTSPYYENRGGRVVFVGGYWRAPNAPFVRPAGMPRVAHYASGWAHGPRPTGPSGTFVPAPPGSKPGLIVPAPLGTPPRVMASQPALVRPGMTVRAGNGGHFQVSAPATAIRSGQRVDARVASAPPRTGEKVTRPTPAPKATERTATTAPKVAPTRPNLDATRAAERTVEKEQRAAPVRTNDPNRVAPNGAQPVRNNMPAAHQPLLPGEKALPQREVAPRGSAPVAPMREAPRAPMEAPRAPMEAPRAPMGPVEREPMRAPEARPVGAPMEPRAMPAEAHPAVAPAAAPHMAAPAAAPHMAAPAGGGEGHR